MIRLSELKLPLDGAFDPPDSASKPPLYPPSLAPLIAQTLGISLDAIADWKVFKRSFDARQKLQVVYIVDVQLHDSSKAQQLLQQHAQHPHIKPHQICNGTRQYKHRQTGQHLAPCDLWWWALGPAACLPRWSWRKWA